MKKVLGRTVSWLAGNYGQSQSFGGPATSTLDVSQSGGLTNFDLTGADNASFSLSNAFQPLIFSNGAGLGYNLVIPTAALASESWAAKSIPL